MTFAYDGSKYNGYQKQPNAKTIQGEIETALTQINNGKKVSLVASGRTDAGVHAYNQRAHFELETKITSEKLKQGINSLIPDDIYVKKVFEVDENFHARFDVKAKEYIYKINMGIYNPIEKDYVYQYNKKLDISEMERALKYLEGTHDFRAFTSNKRSKKSTVRTIDRIMIERVGSSLFTKENHDEIRFTYSGNGFLCHMVRILTGTLLEVGQGERMPDSIPEILASKERENAGALVPGKGLVLEEVYY